MARHGPDDLVVDVCVDFLVSLDKVRRGLAAVGRHNAEEHDWGWMLGPEGSIDLNS
uniref:Uncharacterized protein n=1 Tax=Lepeophtheirus salmonis TaxID=72036 RepID=A0A0K2VBG0_LEPSM